MKTRPSSLPALAQCGSYEPDPTPRALSEAGTKRHKALAAALTKGTELLDALPPDDREGVEWALDYILATATEGEPMQVEQKRELFDADFNVIMRGTLDVTAGPDLWDLKGYEGDYLAQMAAYALMRMQVTGRDTITVHLLFQAHKRAVKYTLTEAKAWEIVNYSLNNIGQPPTPCSHCKYCAKQPTCPALVQRVEAVAAGREDWELKTYHSSEINNPSEMAKALRLARQLSKWCDSVEFHAKQLAATNGGKLPGYKVREKAGRAFVSDVAAAYNAAGLPQEVFLRCCDLRMNTSKTNPDKVGIVDEYAKFAGMKKAPAKRQITEKLSAVLKHNKPTTELVADNETQETDNEI